MTVHFSSSLVDAPLCLKKKDFLSCTQAQANKDDIDEGSALVSVLVRGIRQPRPSASRGPSVPFHPDLPPQKPGLVFVSSETSWHAMPAPL